MYTIYASCGRIEFNTPFSNWVWHASRHVANTIIQQAGRVHRLIHHCFVRKNVSPSITELQRTVTARYL